MNHRKSGPIRNLNYRSSISYRCSYCFSFSIFVSSLLRSLFSFLSCVVVDDVSILTAKARRRWPSTGAGALGRFANSLKYQNLAEKNDTSHLINGRRRRRTNTEINGQTELLILIFTPWPRVPTQLQPRVLPVISELTHTIAVLTSYPMTTDLTLLGLQSRLEDKFLSI